MNIQLALTQYCDQHISQELRPYFIACIDNFTPDTCATYITKLFTPSPIFCNKEFVTWNTSKRLWHVISPNKINTCIYHAFVHCFKWAQVHSSSLVKHINQILRVWHSLGFQNKTSKELAILVEDSSFKFQIKQLTPWLPTNNGQLVNCLTGEWRERVASDFETCVVNASYDGTCSEDDYATVWHFFQLMCGDDTIIKPLLRLLGMCISGHTRKFNMISIIENGGGRYDILMRILHTLLGTSCQIMLRHIDYTQCISHPRVICQETHDMRVERSKLNTLQYNDKFIGTHFFIHYTGIPYINNDINVNNELWLIKFPPLNVDTSSTLHTLAETLFTPQHLNTILYILIQHCSSQEHIELNVPGYIFDVFVSGYKNYELAVFIKACCILDNTCMVSQDKLYMAYKTWCIPDHGSKVNFKLMMQNTPYPVTYGANGLGHYGIRLNDEYEYWGG